MSAPAPDKKQRKPARFALKTIVIVVLLVAGLLLLRNKLLTPGTALALKGAIITQANRNLGEKLRLGRVTFDPFGRLEARDLRIGDAPSAILAADRAVVTWNPFKLISNPKNPAAALGAVTIYRPTFRLERDDAGEWNLSRLMKKSTRPPGAYPPLTVLIRDATVRFHDGFASAPLPFRYGVFHVSRGRLRLDAPRALDARLEIAGPGIPNGARVEAASEDGVRWRLSVDSDRVEPGVLNGFLKKHDIHVAGYMRDVGVRVALGGKGAPPKFFGGVRLDGMAVKLLKRDLTIDDIRGNIAFTGARIALDGVSARFADGRASLKGAVDAASKTPVVSLSARIENVDIEKLVRISGLIRKGPLPSGSLSANVYVLGTVQKPDILLDGSVSDARYGDLALGKVTTRTRLTGKNVYIESLRVSRGESSIEAQGAAIFDSKWKPESIDAAVIARRWPFSDFTRMAKVKGAGDLRGELNAHIAFQTRKGWKEPRIYGEAGGDNLAYRRIGPLRWEAGFHNEGDVLRIENIAARGPSHSLLAHGSVDAKGKLDIEIELAEADVGKTMAAFAPQKFVIAGRAAIRGRVTGTISHPVARATVMGRNVRISDLAWRRVKGEVLFENGVMDATGFRLERADGTETAVCRIDTKRKTLDLTVDADGIPVDDTVGFLIKVVRVHFPDIKDLAGKAYGSFHISGPLRGPRVDAQITLRKVTLYGENITEAKFDLSVDKFITISNGVLRAGNSVVLFGGPLRYDALDLKFEARAFDIGDLNIASQNKIEGSASVSGSLNGTWGSPVVDIGFTSKDVRMRGKRFSVDRGYIQFRDDVVSVQRTRFTHKKEVYQLQGGYDLSSASLDVTIDLENADIETLANYMPMKLPKDTSGFLSGRLRLVGMSGVTTGNITLNSEAITLGGYPLTDLKLDGDFSGSRFTVRQFEAVNKKGEFTASGELDFEKRSSSLLNFQATSVDLNKLTDMKLFPFPVQGMADVSVLVVNEGGEQRMTGSVEAYDLTLMGVRFDRARGQVEYNRDMLTFNNFQFLRGVDRLEISADLPMSQGKVRFVRIAPRTGGFPLEAFNDVPGMKGARLNGKLVIKDMTISGPPDDLEYEGEALISGGFAMDILGKPITDMRGKVVFKGNRAGIDSLTGKMGDKILSVTGGAKLEPNKPIQFELTLADIKSMPLEINDTSSGGSGKDIYNGLVDIEGLQLRGEPGRFVLTGVPGRTPRIAFHDGAFTMPKTFGTVVATTTVETPDTLVFSDREITVVAEKNLLLTQGKNVRLRPEGTVTVSGSLAHPLIKGVFNSRSGTIKYFNTVFTLDEETYIGFYAPQGMGLIPIISAKGRTRRAGADIYIEVSGPLINIEENAAFRRICGEGAGVFNTQTAGESVAIPTIAVGRGGEVTVPVCPRVRLYSNDAEGGFLSSQSVLQKLTHTEGLLQGNENVSTVLTSEFYNTIGSSLGAIVSDQVRIDNFQINLDPNKDLYVQLEKRLSSRLTLRYERLFTEVDKQDLELRYRIRNRSYLTYGIDQDSKSRFKVEYRISF